MLKLIYTAGSANGRQVDSESINLGPNPSPAAIDLGNHLVYI